jgi:hypothetical protein
MRSFEVKVSTYGIIFRPRFVKNQLMCWNVKKRDTRNKYKGTVAANAKIYLYRKENHPIIVESADYS